MDALLAGIDSKSKGNAIARYKNSRLSIGLDPVKRDAFPATPGDSSYKRCYMLATSYWDSRRAHKSTAI